MWLPKFPTFALVAQNVSSSKNQQHNHDNINVGKTGQRAAQHRKYKRVKYGSEEASLQRKLSNWRHGLLERHGLIEERDGSPLYIDRNV